MLIRGLNDQADIVVVVEGTAASGAYLNELKTNYLIPILEYFNQGKVEEDRSYTCGRTNNLFGLVVYHAADILPKSSSDCYGPYYSPKKLLTVLDALQFVDGKGEGHANIAEGLATALQAFQDLHQLREGTDDLTEKHCILICNSPPYSMPVIESPTYAGNNVEQLAATLNKENINLSVLSPRKIPAIFKIFEVAGGDLNQLQNKNYAVDPRHVVLLKGINLKEKSSSLTDEKENLPIPIDTEYTLNMGENFMTQQSSPMPMSPAAYKYSQDEAIGQQFSHQQYVQSSIPESSCYQTGASPFHGQGTGWPPSPHHIYEHRSYSNTQLSSGLMHNPARLSQAQTHIAPQQISQHASFYNTQTYSEPAQNFTNISQSTQYPMSQQMPQHTFYITPTCHGPAQSYTNVSQSTGLPMSQQHVPQSFNTTETSSRLAQGSAMIPQLAQSPAPQVPNFVPDQPNAQLFGMPSPGWELQEEKVAVSGMVKSLDYQSVMSPQIRTNQNVTGSEKGFISISSLIQNMNQQQSTSNQPLQAPFGKADQFQVGSVSSTSDGQVREKGTVWQGILEWIERRNDDEKVTKQLRCQIRQILKEGDVALNTDGWPEKLSMQLMPRGLIASSGGPYLKNSISLQVYPEQCEALESLTKIMSSSFAGCVCFTFDVPVGPTRNKVFVLLYSVERSGYFGFIPNDQVGFVGKLRSVIQDHKDRMYMNRQNQVPGNCSNASNAFTESKIAVPANQSSMSQQLTMTTGASVSEFQNNQTRASGGTERENVTENESGVGGSSVVSYNTGPNQSCRKPILGLPVEPYRQHPIQYKLHPVINEMKVQRKQHAEQSQQVGMQYQVQQEQQQRTQLLQVKQQQQRAQLQQAQQQQERAQLQQAQQQQERAQLQQAQQQQERAQLQQAQQQQQRAQLQQAQLQQQRLQLQQVQQQQQQQKRTRLQQAQQQRAQLHQTRPLLNMNQQLRFLLEDPQQEQQQLLQQKRQRMVGPQSTEDLTLRHLLKQGPQFPMFKRNNMGLGKMQQNPGSFENHCQENSSDEE